MSKKIEIEKEVEGSPSEGVLIRMNIIISVRINYWHPMSLKNKNHKNKKVKTMNDNHVNESLRGLFEGGNFANAQLNVLTGDGILVSYGSSEKGKKDDDAKAQKEGKEAIMEYVGRLRPVVRDQYLAQYDHIWEGILEISQVKAEIFKKGKQQDTTFNRNLLAKIIHQVAILYVPTANNAVMTTHLEPEKGVDHPVRQQLGEMPDNNIKKAVEGFIQANLL